MVRTHPNTVSAYHGMPAHWTRAARLSRTANAVRESIPPRAAGMLAGGAAGLLALPVMGRLAWDAAVVASAGDPCIAMLLHLLAAFALIAAAVAALGGLACGLGDLLESPRQ